MGNKSKKKKDSGNPGEMVEQGLVSLAESIGWALGTVRAKTDGWIDNEKVQKQVSRIRDGAVDLLFRVSEASEKAKAQAKLAEATAARPAAKSAAKPAAKASARSGGTVDAPGKRHRKPPPQESIDKRMGEGEVVRKKAGQQGIKGRMQRRGSQE